jgi:ketosteroid isomerase-like protein
MTQAPAEILRELGFDSRPDAELTYEEIVARNVRVVDLHFHSENPDDVEKAVALYTDDITWEAPSRGVVMKDSQAVLRAYRDIFKTLAYRKTIALRRFATERYVFDDQVAYLKVVGEPTLMANFPFPHGTEISVRLAHCFEMRDGRIVREIAYELWRKVGSAVDSDDIPPGSPVEIFPPLPD